MEKVQLNIWENAEWINGNDPERYCYLYILIIPKIYIYNNILLVLDMSPSPLLRTARWVALGAGYLYGQKRLAELRPIRAAEREKEEGKPSYPWIFLKIHDFLAIANAYMAAEIEASRLAMEEYAKDSYLFGTAKE